MRGFWTDVIVGPGFGCEVGFMCSLDTYRRDGITAVWHPRPNEGPLPTKRTPFSPTALVRACASHHICAPHLNDEDMHLRRRSKLLNGREKFGLKVTDISTEMFQIDSGSAVEDAKSAKISMTLISMKTARLPRKNSVALHSGWNFMSRSRDPA